VPAVQARSNTLKTSVFNQLGGSREVVVPAPKHWMGTSLRAKRSARRSDSRLLRAKNSSHAPRGGQHLEKNFLHAVSLLHRSHPKTQSLRGF